MMQDDEFIKKIKRECEATIGHDAEIVIEMQDDIIDSLIKEYLILLGEIDKLERLMGLAV